MSDKDDDRGSGGFPDEVLRQMQDGHDRFMREIERQSDALSRNTTSVFVSFKDFVDANLTSLLDSFRSLPDNIAELRRKMHEEQQARLQQERECLQRWTGIDDASSDHVALLASRASEAVRQSAISSLTLAMKQAGQMNRHIAADRIEKLYHDEWQADPFLDANATPMLSPGGASEYMRENGNNGYNMIATGNAAFWRWPQEYRWLSPDWFKRSLYSPINIHYDMGGDHWKAAFEDLMCASLDKDFPSRPQHRLDSHQAGLRWMLNLYGRGILPPPPRASHVTPQERLRCGAWHAADSSWTISMQELAEDLAASLQDTRNRSGANDEPYADGSGSELDVYEELERLARDTRLHQEAEALGVSVEEVLDAEHHVQPQHSASHSPSAEEPKRPRVDVLSSLTTSTTTRMPDGTVTTKIVLRQKFADGREEMQEKVHTYQESSTQGQSASVPEQVKPEKNGWFWK